MYTYQRLQRFEVFDFVTAQIEMRQLLKSLQMMQPGRYAIIAEFELWQKHNKYTNISEQICEISSHFDRISANREVFQSRRRKHGIKCMLRTVLTRRRLGSFGKFFNDVKPALFSDRQSKFTKFSVKPSTCPVVLQLSRLSSNTCTKQNKSTWFNMDGIKCYFPMHFTARSVTPKHELRCESHSNYKTRPEKAKYKPRLA